MQPADLFRAVEIGERAVHRRWSLGALCDKCKRPRASRELRMARSPSPSEVSQAAYRTLDLLKGIDLLLDGVASDQDSSPHIGKLVFLLS